MLPITRFAPVRVLPEIGRLLRLLPNCSNRGYSVNISRCTSVCKSVQKYPKNLHTISFSTKGEDYRGVMHKKITSESCYVLISISREAEEEDIMCIFKDVRMYKPEIIKLKNGKNSGKVLLELYPDDRSSQILCFKKRYTVFMGHLIKMTRIDEVQYGAYLGKTMIKVENIPFEWEYGEISNFLKKIDVLHKVHQIVSPSNGSGSVIAGRVHLMFSTQKMKDEVSKVLSETEVIDTVNGGTKRLVVTNSSWMDAKIDNRVPVTKNGKNWKENAKFDYRSSVPKMEKKPKGKLVNNGEDKINV